MASTSCLIREVRAATWPVVFAVVEIVIAKTSIGVGRGITRCCPPAAAFASLGVVTIFLVDYAMRSRIAFSLIVQIHIYHICLP